MRRGKGLNVFNPSEYNARYYQEHREAILTRSAAYKAAHREEIRESHYSTRYGLSMDRLAEMALLQDNTCGMCDAVLDWEAPITQHRPHVDHDHATEKVRGLLCPTCNKHLGIFESTKPQAEAYLAMVA